MENLFLKLTARLHTTQCPCSLKFMIRPQQSARYNPKRITVKTDEEAGPKDFFLRESHLDSQPFPEKNKKLRIIPLGGLEEIGRNMTLFEYEDEIIIVDIGLQFPEEDMFGIDYIIPNISYLKGKEENIRGVIITHGHYDHIGGIPHLIGELGNPTIYAGALTKAIITKRQEDYPNSPKLNIQQVDQNSKVKMGRHFTVEFIHLNHTIPDCLALAINTPEGIVIHTGDFKFDHSPIADIPADIGRVAMLGSQGVLALMSDSTSVETAGYSISESTIQDNLEDIFKRTNGRIIIATFSSLISRIQQILTLSEKYGRKIAVDGYSMKSNIEITKHMGYLKVRKESLIPLKEIDDYPPSQITFLCTGAQGEGNAVLMRIANKEHRFVRIKQGDTVVFSSSVIPGNERTVQGIKDTIYRQGAKVFHYKMMDIHTGGHAHAEDAKMMINLAKPKFFIPIHGNYYMLKLHGEIAHTTGIPWENILIGSNGKVMELTANSGIVTKEKVPATYVMVDGLGVGDIGQVVLRDRQMMSQDGMFTIIVIIDSKTGKIIQRPDIISRGFVYMKGSTELINEAKRRVKAIVEQKTMPKNGDTEKVNWAYLRDILREEIGQFLYNKTQRRPMVLPVVIEV